MKCSINKMNDVTFYNLYLLERKGGRVKGSTRFCPSTYRMVAVTVSKGKVTVDRNWPTTTMLPELQEVPLFIAEHPEVKEIAREVNGTAARSLLERALEAVTIDSL